jgi:hypothetical protein
METQTTLFTLVIGLLIRLAVPILITGLVVYALRRLDDRWKRQAEAEIAPGAQARNIGCWEINRCLPETRSGCLAFANPDTPCWQIFRRPDGQLQERCLICQVFRRSPAPLAA